MFSPKQAKEAHIPPTHTHDKTVNGPTIAKATSTIPAWCRDFFSFSTTQELPAQYRQRDTACTRAKASASDSFGGGLQAENGITSHQAAHARRSALPHIGALAQRAAPIMRDEKRSLPHVCRQPPKRRKAPLANTTNKRHPRTRIPSLPKANSSKKPSSPTNAVAMHKHHYTTAYPLPHQPRLCHKRCLLYPMCRPPLLTQTAAYPPS